MDRWKMKVEEIRLKLEDLRAQLNDVERKLNNTNGMPWEEFRDLVGKRSYLIKLIHDLENRANDYYKGNLVLTKENITFGGVAEVVN
ncbi:MAG: hypothetical protein H9802_07935 [Candidatus Phocaeicola faecipullorum]|nr:hypothetical protein [Candidatus Phocaeicola faecipullorum]